MKKVYLMRHGKRESHFEDSLLNLAGIKQAELTGEYFMELDIKKIFASPLPRTQQTAKIVSEKLDLAVNSDDRLKERLLWGDRRDESYEEFIKEWDRATIERDYKPENGDSSRISGNRLKSVIDDAPGSENTLIVTHSGIIGDYLTNFFPADVLPIQKEELNELFHVVILECSITELKIEDEKVVLLRVNDINHLSQSI